MRSFPFAQERGTTILTPLLVVLAVWLTLLRARFGLLASGVATAPSSLAMCALSVASAVFLILELDHPFYAIIRISGDPPRSVPTQLGR